MESARVPIVGLMALGASLAGGSGDGDHGATSSALPWLAASAAIALLVLSLAQGLIGAAVANAIAGGLFFSIGDVSTELATESGARIAFAITLILGYVRRLLIEPQRASPSCAPRRNRSGRQVGIGTPAASSATISAAGWIVRTAPAD